MTIDPNELYKAEIKDIDPAGITLTTALPGEEVKVLQRASLTSYDPIHSKMMSQLLMQFTTDIRSISSLIVVVRSGQAKIYENFPVSMLIRAKKDLKQYHAVFEKDVLDIEGIKFKDAVFELDVQDNDKFLWLFRDQWNFGCYFDFSGKMKVSELTSSLGASYRNLRFFRLYSFFSGTENFPKLLERGWFPFAQLLHDDFEILMNNTDNLSSVEDLLVGKFDRRRIEAFTQYWWRIPIFNEKKDILNAGIEAFLKGDDSSIILCIKNLYSEIEGIIRLDYHRQHNKSPCTKDLKEYMKQKATKAFASKDSLGFPGLFFSYLNEVIFKSFDVEKGEIPLSRHSVNHGVAPVAEYSRVRALQLILAIDQIHYYLK